MENSWQIQLSKRDKKAATTAAPAPAGTAQSYPFLKAVIGDSTSPCSRQSSCNCSRCMVSPPTSLVPVRPLKTRHQERSPHHHRPQPPLGGETSSKVQPTRSFREKIAAIESSNKLLDRLLARVQDSTPLHHKTETRAVSSIYFSCRHWDPEVPHFGHFFCPSGHFSKGAGWSTFFLPNLGKKNSGRANPIF